MNYNFLWAIWFHYDDVIMGTIASQITSLTSVYSTVYSGADQSKHQSSASLAFVWGIHRGPVNSPHKWPVTRKMSSFDDVIMRVYWKWIHFLQIFCKIIDTTCHLFSFDYRIFHMINFKCKHMFQMLSRSYAASESLVFNKYRLRR